MAESITPPKATTAGESTSPSVTKSKKSRQKTRSNNAKQSREALSKIYELPIPIRTYPLPNFYPGNPFSYIHVICSWLSQTLFPPPAEPSVIYEAIWSEETRSIQVVDAKAMRGLWEQGFFGKGSLSRSEPNWLKRELVRRGKEGGITAEDNTNIRREARIKAKWDRARAEQEAIDKTRREEAEADARAKMENLANGGSGFAAPVGPLELLALPNSLAELEETVLNGSVGKQQALMKHANGHHPGPHAELDGFHSDPSVGVNGSASSPLYKTLNGGHVTELIEYTKPMNGSHSDGTTTPPQSGIIKSTNGDADDIKPLKRQKSVRFSPKVESTTFQLTDPPSPNYSLTNLAKSGEGALTNGGANGHTPGTTPAPKQPQPEAASASSSAVVPATAPADIANAEHLQLMPVEAFFLSYALGALRIVDATTRAAMPAADLFALFRRLSYFPSRPDSALRPDDPFLVHYAVYHHFRALGWVVRAGVKFGVDWLLYLRGPVFSHAEFGLVVLPTYADAWWAEHEGRVDDDGDGKSVVTGPARSWHWLHGVNRLLGQVFKTLVLVYVEIPPPPRFDEALGKGYAELFGQYKIREVLVKRWNPNRNRK